MSNVPQDPKDDFELPIQPRRKALRPLPDLGALFEEEPAAKSAPIQPAPSPAAGESAETAAPEPAQKRTLQARSALTALYDGSSKESKPAARKSSSLLDSLTAAPAVEEQESKTSEENARGLKIPSELETYLPPDTWRKLNEVSPRRGVLINALDRLRSITYLLSTFLPSHLVQEKMRRAVPGLVTGQTLSGTLLFSDVSGFTAMSERLAVLGPEGAERLTDAMNRYFTTMLEILSWSGGILIKFAGDATLVYFPEQENGAQAGWAVRAAQRMMRAMTLFENIDTPTEKVSLKMKIGIASGSFLAASVGSASRMEYGIWGATVLRTMGAEGASTGPGQVIIDVATSRLLDSSFHFDPQAPGYFLVQSNGQELGDFEIKAEQRRARGSIPWSASPQAIVTQMQVTTRQIEALKPFIASELVERIVAHAQHRSVESEFRPTVVMFCNFTGPEQLIELWGEAGNQRITSVLAAYFTAMHDVIARYGGIVTRIDPYSKGTKLLALFGAPVSHEDDPQRAASAALSMNMELELLNERLRLKYARHLPPEYAGAQPQPLVQHRIGLTFGVTYAGQVGSTNRREYTVMGDDVNLAARLMGAGKPGQILLSPAVYEKISEEFIFTRLQPIKVKGKTKPIPIAQLDGPRDHTLASRIQNQGELIGRAAELAQAQQALEKAIAGKATLLVIQGPAGVGKSHLADIVLQQALQAKMRLLSSLSHSYTIDTPYSAWSSILRELAGITLIDLPQIYHDKLNRLVASLKLEPQVAGSLGKLIGLAPDPSNGHERKEPESSPHSGDDSGFFGKLKEGRSTRKGSGLDLWQQVEGKQSTQAGMVWQPLEAMLTGRERKRIYEDVAGLFEKLLEKSPLAFFIEDAHWLDEASQDLLLYLLDRLSDRPVFALAAQRAGNASLAQAGLVLALKPLDLEGTTRLVTHIMIAGLAPLIHQQSSGYPLLVEEITHWIQRSRRIGLEDLKDVLQSSDILQKLVLSSLENLPEMQREVAKIASVVGTEFRVGELQALLSQEVDSVSLSSHLRGLADSQVIEVIEIGVDAHYAFQRSLVRDILYNSLPFDRRRDLHARIADYLSAPKAQRSALHARINAFLDTRAEKSQLQQSETIARHYELAERRLAASRYYLKTAQQARLQQDYERMAQDYQRSLANLEKFKPEALDEAERESSIQEAHSLKAQTNIGLGDLALHNGDYPTALAAYETARASLTQEFPYPGELPEAGDMAIRFITHLALALAVQGRAEEALLLLQNTHEEAGAEQPADLAAEAALAWLLWRARDPNAAQQIQVAHELIARQPTPWTRKIKTLLADFGEETETAREAYLTLNLTAGAGLIDIRLGKALVEQQQYEQAVECYQRAANIWRKKKDQTGVALSQYHLAGVYWKLGDLESARRALNETQGLLPVIPPALRSEGRNAVKQASKLFDATSGRPGSKKWPALQWQMYDDIFRASLIFHF